MGKTLDALKAGSARFIWVVAIEGYKYLLTNGHPLDALTAWASTDWTDALGGLTVDFKETQALSPDEPFFDPGAITFAVAPDKAFRLGDTFGVDTHRKSAGAETYLAATVDSDDTTLTVKSTAAFPNAGELFIGCECIAYTGKTDTTFTGCTRGKYSPYLTEAETRFARTHRVAPADLGDGLNVNIQPVVTAQPRTWIGRWVEIRIHEVRGGVLATRAEAHRVFGGRITEIRDDANSMQTIVQCEHAMKVLADTALHSAQWQGSIAGGTTFVSAGTRLKFRDFYSYRSVLDPGGWREADDLVVVASGASGAYEMNAGAYSLAQLAAALSTWLAQAQDDGDIQGSYAVTAPVQTSDGLRTQIAWRINTNSAGIVVSTASFELTLQSSLSDFLGFDATTSGGGARVLRVDKYANEDNIYQPNTPPNDTLVATDGGDSARFDFTTDSGDLVDNYPSLPASLQKPGGGAWGIFVIADQVLVTARFTLDPATGRGTMEKVQRVLRAAFTITTTDFQEALAAGQVAPITRSAEDGSPTTVRQVLVHEGSFSTLFLALAASTGTYRHNAGVDVYPSGASIPFDLLKGVVDTMDAAPGASKSVVLILEKPTKFSDALRSDFLLRWTFPVWREGSIHLAWWRDPTALDATHNLDEDTKAEAAGSGMSQLSPSRESADWLRNVVKVQYQRNALELGSESYGKQVSFVDRVSADDYGPKAITLSLRNVFSQFAQTGAAVESLLPDYFAKLPLVTRTTHQVRRSMDPRFYWRVTVGDVVFFTDRFARDPRTGLRVITDRAALVISTSFWLGGMQPDGKAAPLGGEVLLLFTSRDPDRTGVAYVPAADVDPAVNTDGFSGGYSVDTNVLRCHGYRYANNDGSEGTDIESFTVLDKILIIEVDPIDPDAPLFWERTVVSAVADELTISGGALDGWDGSRLYHVLYQDWGDIGAVQRAKSYQADDADGLVLDTAAPYLYGSSSPDIGADANEAPDNVSLIPRSRAVDGAGRDVAHETDLLHALDHWIDYKSTQQSGFLFAREAAHTDATDPFTGVDTTGQYKLVAFWPVFLSLEILSNAVYRYLSFAPFVRSTDGTPTRVRITLTRFPPTANNVYGVIPGSLTGANTAFGSAEFLGITSTDPVIPATPAFLTCNSKHPFTGIAWIRLKLGYKAASWGIPHIHEHERQVQELWHLTDVTNNRLAPAPLVRKQQVRNGFAPVAELQTKMNDLAAYGAYCRSQVRFIRSCPIDQLPAGVAEPRVRWRFFFNSGPYADFLYANIVMARRTELFGLVAATKLQLAKLSDATEMSWDDAVCAEVTVQAPGGAISFIDAPSNMASSVVRVLTVGTTDPYELERDTFYCGRFTDINKGRVVSACAWESSLQSASDYGFSASGVSSGTPIFAKDRNTVAEVHRKLYTRGAAQLWNHCSETDELAWIAASSAPNTGSLAQGIGAVTSTAAGTVPRTGSLSASIGTIASSAAGTVVSPAPTFHSIGTANDDADDPGDNGAASSWPDHQAGDIGLFLVWQSYPEETVVALDQTTGTFVMDVTSDDISSTEKKLRLSLFYQVATSSDMDDAVFTRTGGGALAVVVMVIRGAHSSWDEVGYSGAIGTALPSVTSSRPALVINILGGATGSTSLSGWTNASLTSLTERFDAVIADHLLGGVATGELASGASGSTTVTGTFSAMVKLTVSFKGP